MMKRFLYVALATFALGLIASCSGDNKRPDEPQKKEEGTRKYFSVLNLSKEKAFVYTGALGSTQHGKSTTFSFPARKGQSLVFTVKFSATKDWFIAPAGLLPLFKEDGTPNTGDLTNLIAIWDANLFDASDRYQQKPPTSPVSLFWEKSSDYLAFSLSYDESKGMFTATLTNKTQPGKSWNGVFSPGVYSVKNADAQKDPYGMRTFQHYFALNEPANPAFEEYILTGNPDKLLAQVKAETGISFVFSDPVIVVYQGEGHPIFQLGEKDRAQGIKELIQNGDVKKLKAALEQVKGVKAVYTNNIEEILHPEGAKIYYVIGLNNTNDWFLANIEPSDGSQGKFMGTELFDLGIAKDELPGAGAHQVLYGGKPQPESKPIQLVKTSYPIPSLDQIVEVWLKNAH